MNKFYSIILAMAALMSAIACTNDVKPDEENPGITADSKISVSLSSAVIEANGTDACVITVEVDGKVVNEGVIFYDANNKPIDIPNNTFTTTEAGTYTFWVNYQSLNSNKFNIDAVSYSLPQLPEDPSVESVDFHKNLFLIYFTGTGCGNCPYMKRNLAQLNDTVTTFDPTRKYPEFYTLAIAHTYTGGVDPAQLNEPLANALDISSWPSLSFDMATSMQNGIFPLVQKNFDDAYTREDTFASVSAAADTADGKIVIRFGVKAAQDGKYRVGAMLLEDGIYGVQTGGTDESYNIHDDCVRAIIGRQNNRDFTGVDLGNIKAGETKGTTAMFTMKNGWVRDNLHLVVFVSHYVTDDGGKFTITNSASLPIDGSVQYQYK